jgi:hypothetical protein
MKEGCVNLTQCDRIDDVVGGWRTPDASLLDMNEDTDEGEVIVDMMKAGEERCLVNMEEFQKKLGESHRSVRELKQKTM